MAEKIKSLIEFGELFGILQGTEDQSRKIVALYSATLSTIPEKILDSTLEYFFKNWKWGNRLPLPGEIREIAGERIKDGILLKGLAQIAVIRCPTQSDLDRIKGKRAYTPEEAAQRAERAAEILANTARKMQHGGQNEA